MKKIKKKYKLVVFLFAASFIMLLTGCGSKNYSEKEVKSYLNKVYGKDMYTITSQTKEDEQTDLYEIAYDDVTFTVKSYLGDDEKKHIEDQYCIAKSVQYFQEHDYTAITEKYLDKNINIKFYSPSEPCGIIIGYITIDKNTDLNELADLIVQIDSELALKYNEEVSTKYDFTNSAGEIIISKNRTVDITKTDLWEINTVFDYSYSDDTRLTKQDVLAQLENKFGTD